MKKFVILLALLISPVMAQASDLPSKVKTPTVNAPVKELGWDGFYVGVHGGLGMLKPDYWDENYDPGTSDNATLNAKVFGLFAGYNVQSANIIYGLEADLGIGSGKQRADDNTWSLFSMPMNGHVRARVGYSSGKAMMYVAGGLALANVIDDDTDVSYGKFDKNYIGWSIGGGLEYALYNNWQLRAEYLYDQYNSASSTMTGDTPYDLSLNPSSQTVRGGLSYKF